MAGPFLAQLDQLRHLKGEPRVSYPYDDLTYPVVERLWEQTLAKDLPALLSAEKDTERFPDLLLVGLTETKSDRQVRELVGRWERLPSPWQISTRFDEDGVLVTVKTRRNKSADITGGSAVDTGVLTRTRKEQDNGLIAMEVVETRTLPGNVITRYAVDGETQGVVQIDTQLIENPGSAPTQIAGTGATCTITLGSNPSDGNWILLYTNNGTAVPFEFDSYTAGVSSSGGAVTFNGVPSEGTTITMTTHSGTAYVFEFDTGNGVTYGRTAIPIGASAAMTARNFASVVNSTQAFTALMTGDTTVALERVDTGSSNQTITTSSVGTQQVETATAAGTITNGGNATVVVTSAAIPSSPVTVSVAVVGTKQIETLTITEAALSSGTIFLTLTAAGMTGSPKSIEVNGVASADDVSTQAAAVIAALEADADVDAFFTIDSPSAGVVRLTTVAALANDGTMELAADGTTESIWTSNLTSTNTTAGVLGDTASSWAGKVRTALNATSDVTTYFTVSGSGTSIVLTRNTVATNDATLNISLANGTCSGITAAPTSANTTAGSLAPVVVSSSFSGGVTGSTITAGRNRVIIGATAADTASALKTALEDTGYFTSSLVSATNTVTRVGAGSANLTVTKSGSAISVSNFSGGQNLPASVEYQPISDVHGRKVTMRLLNFSSLGRNEYTNGQYRRPRIITGLTASGYEMDNGDVRIMLNWQSKAARVFEVRLTHSVTYDSPGNLYYEAPAQEGTQDLEYDGMFLNVRMLDVINSAISLRFNTSSDNQMYGYIGESVYFPASPGSYTSGTTIIKGCELQPWKYGLWRKVKTTFQLP